MSRTSTARAVVLCLLLGASAVHAQQLLVGSGSRLTLGSGTLLAGCADVRIDGSADIAAGNLRGARNVRVDGVMQGGTGTLSLSGDLAAPGLLPQSGTVRIESGCATAGSTLSGNHSFNRLIVDSTTAFALVLPAGATQTIAAALVLRGGIERLVLRSSTPGALALLWLMHGASQSILRIDAIDIGAPEPAQYLAPVDPASIDSIDRGNTPRFLGGIAFAAPLFIPTLSELWLGLLLLLIAVPAYRRFRARTVA